MKRIYIMLLVLGLSKIAITQSPTNLAANLPEIIPPSPDAAAFIKAGLGGVNYSTGAVSVNLPLYDVKLKNFNIPISLSYSSQGTKVDEIPSRVGMGWSLQVGGMITRIVHGVPDELGVKLTEPTDLTQETYDNFNYLNTAAKKDLNYDTQADEFMFNFNGISGKFILDAAYNPVIISHNNLKIEAFVNYPISITGFVVTTTDGVKYRFGYDGQFERTINHNLVGYILHKDVTRTSFFLNSIEYPTGEIATFNYSSVNIKSHLSVTQSLSFSHGVTFGNNGACFNCPAPNTVLNNTLGYSIVEYATKYLTSISCSNGIEVIFGYQDRPDLSGDNRLNTFSVVSNGNTIKHFTFQYLDPVGMDGTGAAPGGGVQLNGRFFLQKVTYNEPFVNQQGNLENKYHDYVFDYNDITGLPGRLSFSQDHFGFYNGKLNANFIPKINNFFFQSIANANRSPDWNFSVKGTLSKITYPTGGNEEFFYEPNTIPITEKVNTITSQTIASVGGGAIGGTSTGATVYSSNINILRTQIAKIYCTSSPNPSYSGSTIDPTSADRVLVMKLKDLNSQQYVFTATIYAYSNRDYEVNLLAGHSYLIEMIVYGGEQNYGTSILEYDYSLQNIYNELNKETGGVRVKQIRATDPVAKVSTNKYFHYASLDLLTKSSGIGAIETSYKAFTESVVISGSYCNDYYINCVRCYEKCLTEIHSSNSIISLSNFEGSHIYYTNIIEANELTFANGGIEYIFYTPAVAKTDMLIRGFTLPAPHANYPVFNGLKHRTKYFDNTKRVVKDQIDYYNYDGYINTQVGVSIVVRRKYDFYLPANQTEINTYNDFFHPFDVNKYFFRSHWIRLDSSIVNIYDDINGTLTTKTSYGYGNPNNILPREIKTKNSKSEEIKSITYYPTDYPNDGLLSAMVNKNMISVPVMESFYKGNIEQSKKQTVYKDWFNDGKVYKPELVKLKPTSTSTLNNEIVFSKYDLLGNIIEVSKQNDIKSVYLWDYNGQLPIAEIKNASVDQIAYSSFEAQTLGGWQLVTGGITNNIGFTGSKSFSGTLSKTISIADTYTITLWTTTSVLVNNTVGSLVSSKNGWSQYRWSFVNPTMIEVSGTNIDELRLYPTNATVVTFTHKPFIGIETTSDQNGIPVFYEYDALNRLILIRDSDRNIVKQFQYTNKDIILPCANTSPNWVATGVKRCLKTANNNFTGIEEGEERDFNNCSPTYLQLRWISLGTTSNCNPIPNCSAPDKRVVNGICETGIKIFVNSVRVGNTWTCTYHYVWSDGFVGQDFTETSTSGCDIPEV